jgi:hypothetical protein
VLREQTQEVVDDGYADARRFHALPSLSRSRPVWALPMIPQLVCAGPPLGPA